MVLHLSRERSSGLMVAKAWAEQELKKAKERKVELADRVRRLNRDVKQNNSTIKYLELWLAKEHERSLNGRKD